MCLLRTKPQELGPYLLFQREQYHVVMDRGVTLHYVKTEIKRTLTRNKDEMINNLRVKVGYHLTFGQMKCTIYPICYGFDFIK